MKDQPRRPEKDVMEEAAYWFAGLRNDDRSVAFRKAFRLWYEECATHREAFERISVAWAATEALSDKPDMLGLRHAAIRRSAEPHPRRYRRLAAAAAVVLATVVGVYGWFGLHQAERVATASEMASAVESGRIFETAIGERSTFQLDDGSTVHLNTASKLRVSFDDERRALVLTDGQALFDVATSPDWPFVVFAGDRRITALGTQFEVRVDREEVAVTLLEGKVEVAELAADDTGANPEAPHRIELVAGQRVAGDQMVAQSVSGDDLSRAISWREGRLDFKDEALEDVIYEINRYSLSKVRLDDPALGKLRVSGSFKAGPVENFVSALTELYPLDSEATTSASGTRQLLVFARSTTEQ